MAIGDEVMDRRIPEKMGRTYTKVNYPEPQSPFRLVRAEHQRALGARIGPSGGLVQFVDICAWMQHNSTYELAFSCAWYTLATAAVTILLVELEVGIAFFILALSSADKSEWEGIVARLGLYCPGG